MNRTETKTPLILHTLLAALLALPTSCTKEEAVPGGGGSLPVAFMASVRPQTRLGGDAGNEWEAGDRIGVFKYRLENAAPTAESAAVNVPYNPVPGTSGKLSPVAGTYPIACLPDEEGTGFIAYYPYRTGITGLDTYSIDLSDQTDPSAIDLLYAKMPTDYDPAAKDPVVLEFTHQLAKLVLTVEAGDDIGSLNDLTVAIGGMHAIASFDLQGTQGFTEHFGQWNITPRYVGQNAAGARLYEALLLPVEELTNFHYIAFTAGGKQYFWLLYTNLAALEAGHKYSFHITVNQYQQGLTISQENNQSYFADLGGFEVFVEPEYSLIPGGYFRMGSSDGSNQNSTDPDNEVNVVPAEPGRGDGDAEYQHWVLLTHDYWMSKYEITNAQFVCFLNINKVGSTGKKADIQNGEDLVYYNSWNNPPTNIPGPSIKGEMHDGTWIWKTTKYNLPAIVPWCGAKAFAEWMGGDLPTAAEWERAARDGMDDLPFGLGNGKILNWDIANYSKSKSYIYDLDLGGSVSSSPPSSKDTLQRVDRFGPSNRYRLYNMHGNAEEWCADTERSHTLPLGNEIREATTKNKAVVNPYIFDPGDGRFYNRRGGGFGSMATECRSASRVASNATDYKYSVPGCGFRVVIRRSTCADCY